MSKDFKVKDINLADFGRKEISIAETEMPGLMALRNEYKNKKVLPYIKRLDWLIGEEDFVSRRELVVLDFRLFFKSYERNESIIRLEIPESKNPSWNDPAKRRTVCFSSEEFFCKKYDLPKKQNG